MNLSGDFEIAVRRFLAGPLSGDDLQALRHSLLDVSQEQLANMWDLSRNQVSRIESMERPPQRICDMYVGAMLRRFFSSRAILVGQQHMEEA